MRVKFGVLEQTQGLHLHAKCHLSLFIVSASGGEKSQFWANFDICGLLCRPPFTDEGQIWYAIVDQGILLCAKFRIDRCILSPSGDEKVHFCCFWTLAFTGVVSPIGSSLRKLDTVPQLQTFPYPMVSKSFLYSSAFIAKSGAQSLTFKSLTDRQTKTQRFWLPRRRVKSEPHQTCHVDRGPRARSCTSKNFWGLDT